jgi:uncharacterized membrane protein SpoIIM required for sporulation
MNEQTFVDRRETDWQRLTKLCDRADVSPSHLQAEEIREIVRLYRRVSTDLSVARTKSNNVQLIEFLNDLTARAYGILYREPRKPFLKSLLNAIALSAQTVRRCRWFILTSAILFFGSGILAYVMLSVMPQMRDFFVQPGFESSFEGWKSGKFTDRTGSESVMMTGFYASNNPRAAILTGAVGAGSFGIGSVYLVVTNGALIGTLAHEVAPRGHLDFLFSSISPHGVPELTGLIISGACGLLLGYALINPGRRKRGDALRAVGRDAMVLLVTSVVLMFIAAPIEGFFSFNPYVPGYAKLIFAGVSFVAWMFFWSSFGKDPAEREPEGQWHMPAAPMSS